MITTRPDWTTDHLTGMTKSLLSCERSVKIGGTGPATAPLNTNCGKDDTGTAEGHIHRMKEGNKIRRCPPGIGEQMPPLTYSSSDTDLRSSHEGPEIFHQQVMVKRMRR